MTIAISSILLTCRHSEPSQQLTIIHITEAGGIDDNSFNAIAWYGITSFYRKHHLEAGYSYLVSTQPAMLQSNLQLATDSAPSLISVAGFNFSEPLAIVATDNLQQYYILIDGVDPKLSNVKTVQFAEEQAAFLVGYLTALKAQEAQIVDPVFGFIGGMPIPVITRFEVGYTQGIKARIPNATIISYYTNDWVNPALAKIRTEQWLNSYPQLFAVFSAAGPSGNGTIAKIKEAYRSGRTVWAIGVDSDQYDDGLVDEEHSVVLTSALKHIDVALHDTLQQLHEGFFNPGLHRLTLKHRGVGFSKRNHIALSDQLLLQMNAITEAIINGEIEVVNTIKAARHYGIVTHHTVAVDD